MLPFHIDLMSRFRNTHAMGLRAFSSSYYKASQRLISGFLRHLGIKNSQKSTWTLLGGINPADNFFRPIAEQ
jgi:hypothetical protein